jgi:hypothetical protein
MERESTYSAIVSSETALLRVLAWLALVAQACIPPEPPPPPPEPVDTCIVQTALTLDSLFTCSKGWTTGGVPGTWTCTEGSAETLDDAIGVGYPFRGRGPEPSPQANA